MTEKEYHRPKKPYTVTPSQQPNSYTGHSKKPFQKPKQVVTPAKNNANNKLLHTAMTGDLVVKITINNLLSSDTELLPTYFGKIRSFDDFTIAVEVETEVQPVLYLINKSSISVVEFLEL